MVRIRYNVNESETELLSKPIESTLGVLRTRISRTDTGWKATVQKFFQSEEQKEWTELEGTESITKNLSVAKAKVKKTLRELGVNFLDEVRRRGVGGV